MVVKKTAIKKSIVKKTVATKSVAAKPIKAKKTTAAKKPVVASKTPAAKKPVAAKKPPAARKKPASASPVAALAQRLAKVIDDNKGEEIVTLNLKDKCSFADFMIVASGRAPRHVVALADYVADALKKNGTPALSIEGKESGDWVLIDAGDIVVHIFRPEVRHFYNIEKMWALPAPAL